MTETKLPTIENFESGELTLRGILNAHEQYAKERIEEWTKSGMHGRTLQRWIGYLEAVQSLRGEKK